MKFHRFQSGYQSTKNPSLCRACCDDYRVIAYRFWITMNRITIRQNLHRKNHAREQERTTRHIINIFYRSYKPVRFTLRTFVCILFDCFIANIIHSGGRARTLAKFSPSTSPRNGRCFEAFFREHRNPRKSKPPAKFEPARILRGETAAPVSRGNSIYRLFRPRALYYIGELY